MDVLEDVQTQTLDYLARDWAKMLPEDRYNLAAAHCNLGNVLEARGKRKEALDEFRKILKTVQDLVKLDPQNPNWREFLGLNFMNVGVMLSTEGTPGEALESLRASLDVREKLAASDPGRIEWKRDVAQSCYLVGLSHRKEGGLGKARDSYRRGLDISRGLLFTDSRIRVWTDERETSAIVSGKLRRISPGSRQRRRTSVCSANSAWNARR